MATTVEMAVARLLTIEVAVSVTTCCTPLTSELSRAWISPVRVAVKKRSGICCGLSLIWLARRMMFHDETPEQRAASLISGPGFQWGGKTQDIHNASPASGSGWGDYLEAFLSEALRAYVLRLVLICRHSRYTCPFSFQRYQSIAKLRAL